MVVFSDTKVILGSNASCYQVSFYARVVVQASDRWH